MKDEGIKIPAVFQSSINGSGGGTKEIKKTSDISQIQVRLEFYQLLQPSLFLPHCLMEVLKTTVVKQRQTYLRRNIKNKLIRYLPQQKGLRLKVLICLIKLYRILHLQQSSLQIKQILFQMELLLCIAECSKHLMMSRTQSVCYLMYQSIKYHY